MRTPAGKHRRFSQVGYVRSPPILQVASANRLIVGAALASPRRSIKFFVDEPCSSLTFDRLSTQEAPPEIPKSSLLEFLPLFQLLEPTTTTTRLHTRANPEMQPSATSPYVVVYFRQNPALFATLSQPARSKISLPTPTTTYTFNNYLAVLGKQSVFEMAHYKSTAQNPFGGLQAFLNDHRVLFSPLTLKTYFREDLISLATRVKDIFGLVDAWTANINNELPLAVDRAWLTVFRNLRDAYDPSIFEEDAELGAGGGRKGFEPGESPEPHLRLPLPLHILSAQGLAQLVSLADCKFGRPETPFLTKTTNEDGEEVSIEPDHSSINFGPPEKGEKFYLSPPIASSRRNPFTGGDGASTSKPPPIPPKLTRKSAFSGLETKSGAATPSNATKTAMATRSAPGTTTSTRTSETTQKQPTKPAKTATKPATASKAPAKISGGASKSSTPAPARPWLPKTLLPPRLPIPILAKGLRMAKISSAQELTPASNLRATKERAARSRTLPAIAVLEGSPEPPPAKKQRLSKPAPTTNAQASSSTAAVLTKIKPKAMAGEDDRGWWHRHYKDFPHVLKLPQVNPQPNYPNAQSLLLVKRNGIFANVDTDPAPELLRVEALAAYTDRVVNGPYPWKCNQCNTSRKTCVFRGHAKNSSSIERILPVEWRWLRLVDMASEAQRARRLRHEADLLIEHAARLHYEADIMTAHNTVAVLQILNMSPNDKKLVDEYRQIDDDIRDLFDNVGFYKDLFPDLNDPRFSLPSDSQMKSPKKRKRLAKATTKAKAPSKKGKEKAVEPVKEEEEEYKEEEEPEMDEEVEETQELGQSASPTATERVPSDDEEDDGGDTDHTYHPPKSQSEEEEIPPTDSDGERDSQQEEEDEDKVFDRDQLHSSPIRPSILGFEEEAVEREDVVDEGTMQSVVDVILGRDTEEERETAEPCIDS
ncbi:hypothetical protein K435DRAFT_868878 [Dendrothele bispora CBS 962.96]|uniref:Uncharacterized protein n=1 Tax=Dendrothele bispora (strain CBS 962.96) TaxID=1314807 RepID=A0A4S8LAR5_DENBC|nr:hypothetical protein K435DRAFT_868878 [Dendrothele bispora CBS 962.96]